MTINWAIIIAKNVIVQRIITHVMAINGRPTMDFFPVSKSSVSSWLLSLPPAIYVHMPILTLIYSGHHPQQVYHRWWGFDFICQFSLAWHPRPVPVYLSACLSVQIPDESDYSRTWFHYDSYAILHSFKLAGIDNANYFLKYWGMQFELTTCDNCQISKNCNL